MIKVEDVWKIYGKGEAKTIALKNINLEIEEGEFVMIIGPSGCGKSTLFKMITGILTEYRGEILIEGEKNKGEYQVYWNGLDSKSNPVSSGIYFFKMKADNYIGIRKGLLLK